MDKKLLAQYKALEDTFKTLEAERTILREKIVAEMQKNKTEKIETDYGKFTVAERITWSYTDKIKKMEEKVKIAKIKEQQKGEAKESTINYLVYSPVKE